MTGWGKPNQRSIAGDWNHRRSNRGRYGCQRRGSLLLIVLVVIVILSLSAYTFTSLMRTEAEATRLMTLRIQTKYLADSGLDYTRLFLSNSEATVREQGGRWDNQEKFRGIPVAAEANQGGRRGFFTIAAPNIDADGQPSGFRYGVTDESSKINLNTLVFSDLIQPGSARQILLTLPEMTESVADAMMDWLDPDDDPREFGVESSFYQSQSPGYMAKNGPMESLDELLLIDGVTPQLLFGFDTNRNGILDSSEAALNGVSADEAGLHLGWATYLTLHSKESNLTAEGLPRININADDLEQLFDDLKSTFNDEWANFIILYRCAPEGRIGQIQLDDLGSSDALNGSRVQLDFDQLASQRKFDTVLDLVNVAIDASSVDDEFPGITTPDDNLNDTINSPITLVNMGFTAPLVMASLTTFEGPTIPGRINIMQASRQVLLAIPGLDEEVVDDIIDRRKDDFELDDPDGADRNRRYETWLLVEGVVPLGQMKSLMKYVCAGGDVYRTEIVGFFPDGIGTSRAEAVIDTTVAIPRVLFWRDKSHLSSGFSSDFLASELIVQ